MTTNADGSVNTAGINTFADSVVAFLRTVRLQRRRHRLRVPDVERRTRATRSTSRSPTRAGPACNAGYAVLMKTLREKLDAAARRRRQVLHAHRRRARLRLAAARHGDLPGHAVPRLHQHHVLRPARRVEQVRRPERGALRRRQGRRAGRRRASTAPTRGIGYLNTDWAYHYFRGSMQAGRINIGVPYYTRGCTERHRWHERAVGHGAPTTTAARPAPHEPRAATARSASTTSGTTWTPTAARSRPARTRCGTPRTWRTASPATTSPRTASPGATDRRLTGTYARNYNSTLVAPWLWNAHEEGLPVHRGRAVDRRQGRLRGRTRASAAS